MHKCFPKHSRTKTTRMKEDKETEEEDKQEMINMGKCSRHEIKNQYSACANIEYILVLINQCSKD